jgi:predicted nucleic acid-binding Zn ribbon protein
LWKQERCRLNNMKRNQPQKSKPVLIQNIVLDVLKKRGYETPVKEQLILVHWGEIAGEAIAGQSTAVALENSRLFINVPNASWRNELTFLKPNLLKKINDFAGKVVVKDIIFTGVKRDEQNV